MLHKKILPDAPGGKVSQVIPNAREEDFYVELFPCTQQEVYVSVARRDMIDEVVATFTEKKRSVISLTLGPMKAAILPVMFGNLTEQLMVPPYRVDCNTASYAIKSLTRLGEHENYKDVRYRIGTYEIPCECILPFSHALGYYLGEEPETVSSEVARQKDEYSSKRVFNSLVVFMLMIVFIIVLAGRMGYYNYAGQKSGLENRIEGNAELLEDLKKLRDEFTWKEKFLKEAGILHNSHLSYFADRIAATVPKEVTMEAMELHPVLSKIKKQKEIELQGDAIILQGTTLSSLVLNDWMRELKKMTWIKQATVSNYLQDNAIGTFLITIQLNN